MNYAEELQDAVESRIESHADDLSRLNIAITCYGVEAHDEDPIAYMCVTYGAYSKFDDVPSEAMITASDILDDVLGDMTAMIAHRATEATNEAT